LYSHATNAFAKITIATAIFEDLPLELETAMSSPLIKVVTIIALLTGTARAQIPGDSPNMGVGAAVAGSRGLGIVSRPHVWEGYQSERNYSDTVKRIPDKKSSNDPWKNVRESSTTADRHRPQ